MQTQGVKREKGKENYWIKIDYKTGYVIKEYRLGNRCYLNKYILEVDPMGRKQGIILHL